MKENEPQTKVRSQGMEEDDELYPLRDVPLVVGAELGRTHIKVRDFLQLAQGMVVNLDKNAGDPLDLYIHGHLVAHGEAVVINDQYGVRLTEVVGQRLAAVRRQ